LRGNRQTNRQQNEERRSSPAPSAASSQAAASLQAAANSRIEEQSSSPAAADSSPPRQIAALTPPRIVAAPSKLFNNETLADLVISPHIRKWEPIANGKLEKPPVDNVDYTHMIPGGLKGLLKRQGEQNERAMHNILGHAGRKVKQEAKERILARQEEQRNRQAFHMLQDPGNKQKLRCPHILTPVPMGLPSTSAEWNKKDSDEWCRKHVPNWHSGRKIIDVVSDDDKMDSYYEEVKKLYKVPRPTTGRTSTLQPASAATQRHQQRPHAHQMTAGNNKACSLSRQFTNNFLHFLTNWRMHVYTFAYNPPL
jgi:hypothetical protein